MTPIRDLLSGPIGIYIYIYIYLPPNTHTNKILYGTWEALDGCKILPVDVGIISLLAESFSKKCFFCRNLFLHVAKPSKGRIYIRSILASGKTPSVARHTIGCAPPDDIDTNPGLSKTMTREASY